MYFLHEVTFMELFIMLIKEQLKLHNKFQNKIEKTYKKSKNCDNLKLRRRCMLNQLDTSDSNTHQKTVVFCGFALTEVAVGRYWHKLRVQEMLVSNFIGAVIKHSHLQQSVVLLLYSYDACTGGERRNVCSRVQKYTLTIVKLGACI